MYPAREARELAILLRISRELDICGDVTATVDNPSELLAWAAILTEPVITAWRAEDSGCRFVQVSADHQREPVRGHVSAVLACDQHPQFWDQLPLEHLAAGRTRALTVKDLATAWAHPTTGHPPRPWRVEPTRCEWLMHSRADAARDCLGVSGEPSRCLARPSRLAARLGRRLPGAAADCQKVPRTLSTTRFVSPDVHTAAYPSISLSASPSITRGFSQTRTRVPGAGGKRVSGEGPTW